MLFIPTSFLRSLVQLTLGSSWTSSLLHRIHVAVSCLFLGFSGSCHRLIPHGQCVSGVPSSMVWCSKLSVHIFVCWEVTTEVSFSALVVTDCLLLTLHTVFFFSSTEAHAIKRRRYLSGAHIILRGSLAFKRTGPTQHSCYCTQWPLCPRWGRSHFCAHWHHAFVYLAFVLVSTAHMLFNHF